MKAGALSVRICTEGECIMGVINRIKEGSMLSFDSDEMKDAVVNPENMPVHTMIFWLDLRSMSIFKWEPG